MFDFFDLILDKQQLRQLDDVVIDYRLETVSYFKTQIPPNRKVYNPREEALQELGSNYSKYVLNWFRVHVRLADNSACEDLKKNWSKDLITFVFSKSKLCWFDFI